MFTVEKTGEHDFVTEKIEQGAISSTIKAPVILKFRIRDIWHIGGEKFSLALPETYFNKFTSPSVRTRTLLVALAADGAILGIHMYLRDTDGWVFENFNKDTILSVIRREVEIANAIRDTLPRRAKREVETTDPIREVVPKRK
jgi:hypothetical protein